MCLKDESKGCKEVRFYHIRTFIDICRSLAYMRGNYTTTILELRRINLKYLNKYLNYLHSGVQKDFKGLNKYLIAFVLQLR
jgi:hypothetical protein